MIEKKALSLIIITYNRPEDLLRLLKNIAGQEQADKLLDRVVIIDNASTVSYTSVTDFLALQQLPFHYIRSEENLGVARGRNKAISEVQSPVVITLDDDAIFRETDALIKIDKLFRSEFALQNRVGVYCFKVFWRDTEDIQQSAFPHKQFNKYRNKDQFLTSYYIGCAHAILLEAYHRAGNYPADFFYGMEEYDLGYRILDAGYKIAYDSSVTVAHFESPKGRVPDVRKIQMLWVNKSKMAYRNLPYRYFISISLMWSLQFIKKWPFAWGGWFEGWKKIFSIPRTESRKVVRKETLEYIHQVEGRLWY
ncbi:MAG: glycosyltransferase [Chitinophagaceae bacterium]|nr:glycosyltransferase [Chitinophagaceae bacterium]